MTRSKLRTVAIALGLAASVTAPLASMLLWMVPAPILAGAMVPLRPAASVPAA